MARLKGAEVRAEVCGGLRRSDEKPNKINCGSVGGSAEVLPKKSMKSTKNFAEVRPPLYPLKGVIRGKGKGQGVSGSFPAGRHGTCRASLLATPEDSATDGRPEQAEADDKVCGLPGQQSYPLADQRGAGRPGADWRQRRATPGLDALRNTRKAIIKAERKLANSMAHVARPREGDLVRWQAMEARLADLHAELGRLQEGGAPIAWPARPPPRRLQASIKASYRNTAKES